MGQHICGIATDASSARFVVDGKRKPQSLKTLEEGNIQRFVMNASIRSADHAETDTSGKGLSEKMTRI